MSEPDTVRYHDAPEFFGQSTARTGDNYYKFESIFQESSKLVKMSKGSSRNFTWRESQQSELWLWT